MIRYLDKETTIDYRCHQRGELNDTLRQPTRMELQDVPRSTENGTLVVTVSFPSDEPNVIGPEVRRDRHGRAYIEDGAQGLVQVGGLEYDAHRSDRPGVWNVNVHSDGEGGQPGWHRIGRVRAADESELPAAVAHAADQGWPYVGGAS